MLFRVLEAPACRDRAQHQLHLEQRERGADAAPYARRRTESTRTSPARPEEALGHERSRVAVHARIAVCQVDRRHHARALREPVARLSCSRISRPSPQSGTTGRDPEGLVDDRRDVLVAAASPPCPSALPPPPRRSRPRAARSLSGCRTSRSTAHATGWPSSRVRPGAGSRARRAAPSRSSPPSSSRACRSRERMSVSTCEVARRAGGRSPRR